MGIICVNKLEASRRQLVQAIKCFFNSGDMVAIHTLAAASRQILGDICIANGKKRDLEDSDDFSSLDSKSKKELISSLREPQNFLKHADKDPNGALEFNVELTELFIHDACQLYKSINGKLFKEGMVFQLWMFKKYPDKFGGVGSVKKIVPAIDAAPHPDKLQKYIELMEIER